MSIERDQNPARLFPVFLKLKGRVCLVVGAGKVGEPKIQGLLETGAQVRVIAPSATEQVSRWATEGRIEWLAREFIKTDLDGVFLAVVATANRGLNAEIFRLANERGVLCNVVDDPPQCDFYYGAIVRRGDLQIAVSSNGHSPSLAQRIRVELEQRYGPLYEPWIEHLGRVRRRLFARQMDPGKRRLLLHRIAAQDRFETFASRFPAARAGGPVDLEASSR
jgi:siroheme synthase-like protein